MMSHARQFLIPFLFVLLVACASETAQQSTGEPRQTAQPEVESAETMDTVQPPAASPTTPAIGAATAANATPTDTAQSNPAGATEAPPTEVSATETVAPAATGGRSADGAYFLGREDAPLTIIDYSDFL